MNPLRTLLTTASLVVALAAMSQLNVYKTYSDYVNKKPTTHPDAEFKKWTGEENSVLVFTCGGKEVQVECAGIWGFEYKDALFRVSTASRYFVKRSGAQLGVPFVVTHRGDVVMYENGLPYLKATSRGRSQAMLTGMCAALSKDLNSDMAVVPCTPVKATDEQLLLLVNSDPGLKDLAGELVSLKKKHADQGPGCLGYEQLRAFMQDHDMSGMEKGW